MGAIIDLNEAWHGHTGLEVETFLKSQIGSLISSVGGKFGYAELSQDGKRLLFYDYEGGSELGSVTFSGDIYTVTVNCDLGNAFYVLGSETTKNITITASTTVGAFGSQDVQPFPEAHSYTMSVDSGSGYVVRKSGVIPMNGEEVIDIRPFVTTGDNYVRLVVTGLTSGQTKTTVLTATVTSLWMTCSHTWQNPWMQGESYVVNNIRFAGSVEKYLHISLDGTEIDSVKYNPNQSYTSTATTYTIPATSFPEGDSSVHTITLWMTAQGVSTEVIAINTMCIAEEDDTPIICINSITDKAVNFTDSNLFAYAVYNASYAKFNVSALMEGSVAPIDIVTNRIVEATPGIQYPFSVSLEIESEAVAGTLTSVATALDSTQAEGVSDTVTIPIDNTYSYLATSGALFYLNPANRSNAESNYETIINEAVPDSNFTPTYNATWDGMAWGADGWTTDADNHKCLFIPARASVTIPTLTPLNYLSAYQTGMTIEMMIQAGNPSDYDTPIITLSDASTLRGITIYPTKIVVLGNNVLNETVQMVNLCENRITHLAITFTKNYAGEGTSFNLCSVYVNGISNINFSFGGNTTFGSGALKIGAPDVDTYVYKMRIYGKALEAQDVLNNFLNCIIDGVEFTRRDVFMKNDILLGGEVGYEMVKAAGLNTMVIYLPNDSTPLPDINHDPRPNAIKNCSWKFEYADHPEWNFTIGNVDIDGQGTTSMRYYRWNLRAKTSSSTTWTYESPTMIDSQGKSGYFAGTSNPMVDRITAKKNYASSMQGHKMGLTGLYDDIYTQLGLKNELPNPTFNVAVYQYPFVGFRYYEQSDFYEYIGLYTAGPDKSSKVTFGYSSSYEDCMSLEGPDHAPLATRFLHPWVDVTYSPADESLLFGGGGGWDCDYVKYETGYGKNGETYPDDWAAIRALYESEWKPAYEIVYHCSPYIESLSVAMAAGGYADIQAVNDDIDTFRNASTNGVKNEILSFYDNNYDIWFYRTQTGKIENLTTVEGSSDHNILTYLGLTGSPTTAQIKAARAAKFKNEMANYWSLDQTLYHYCFCILLGITDNFAKNSYPFKFNALNTSGVGNRWGWRQDDLDTAFMTDNNGEQTKAYYVEHGDVNNEGGEIYQGGDSALWTLIRDNYESEIKTMMNRLVNSFTSIASDLGVLGRGPSEHVFNVISYYCWEHSAKYFSQTLYEKDKVWSYITPWIQTPGTQYNNVWPLTQALGDQYQAERLWVERRIAYIFSKYNVGEYTHDQGGSGDISFTLGQQYTFNPIPAIDMYPVISRGTIEDYTATRTQAGHESSDITVPASTNTTVYIHGADWLSSLGDLHDMVLTTRGGDVGIPFSVTSKRLVELILGAPSGVLFNATSLAVESPTITRIDARNTSTINNSVSLLRCPRLKEAYFAGSGATGLTLPVGSRVTDVSFPENVTSLYLNQLHMLENVTWPTSVENIESLYISDTPAADALSIFQDIMETQDNKLKYITMYGDFEADLDQLTHLRTIANDSSYGKVVYDGDYSVDSTTQPDIEGTLITSETDPIGANLVYDIEQAFPNLDVDIPASKQYIDFVDDEVERIALANWDTDQSDRLMRSEAEAVTSLAYLFAGNTEIETFNELKYFKNVKSLPATTANGGQFQGCTALREITLPSSLTSLGLNSFRIESPDWGSLEKINLENITSIGIRFTFARQKNLEIEVNMPNLTGTIEQGNFYQSGITKVVNLGSITSIGDAAFSSCPNLTEVTLQDTVTYLSGSFRDNPALITVIANGVTNAAYASFRNDNALTTVVMPSLRTIGNEAFSGCSSLTMITGGNNIKTIGESAFACSSSNRGSLSQFDFSNVSSIGNYAFRYQDLSGLELSIPNYSATQMGKGLFAYTNIAKIVNLGTELTTIGYTTTTASSGSDGNFSNCKQLTDVILPTTVTTIGRFTFTGCSSLVNIAGLDNVTTVGGSAFNACTSLESITLLKVTSLAANAFNGCTSLQSVSLPVITSASSEDIFKGCTSLTSFIAPNLTTLSSSGFLEGAPIHNLVLPSLTTLRDYVFRNCKVDSITLSSIQTIYGPQFLNCSELITADFGPNLTTINGGQVFFDCSKLQTVIFRGATPPTVTGSTSLIQGNRPNVIYVPYSADHSILAAYQSATNLTTYASLMAELNPDGTIPE